MDDINFNYSKPLFDNGNGGNASYLYRSMITGYQPGLPGRLGIRKDSIAIRTVGLNQGLMRLYKKAWQLPAQWPDSRVLFEKLDRDKYEITNWYKEQQSKAWCYELILPLAHQEQLYPIMQQDLIRFFNIQGRVEDREVDCLVLVNSNKKLRPVQALGERENNLAKTDGQMKYLKNDWLSSLTEQMNSQHGMPLILDETGISYTLNMVLGNSLSDIASLNKELALYGLMLKEEKRTMFMLVLSPAQLNAFNNTQN